jgi:hypothetical protein
MPKYEIWIEGWIATGGYGNARFIAEVEAPTFREACAQHYGNDRLYNAGLNTWWGCHLYSNEADARKKFG